MDLDRPEAYGQVDPADALADVEATAEQWSRAPRPDRLDLAGVNAVVVTGVGGSGISGDLVAALAAERLPVPVLVHKTYGLPAYVDARSVVVAVSCSGETEETMSAAEEALRRRARLLVVAGGGALGRLCGQQGHPYVRVPRQCQPRHSLGSLTVPVLAALGLDDGLEEAMEVQRRLLDTCGRHVPVPDNPAKQLAHQLAHAGHAVVHGAHGLAAAAAYRLKCQLNENAKLPVRFGELPEATHNEIVAWEQPHTVASVAALVLVRDPDGEPPRVRRRIEVLAKLLADRFVGVSEIFPQGRTPLARLASLLLFGDLTSVYTALLLDRDPTPIALIDELKRQMAGE